MSNANLDEKMWINIRKCESLWENVKCESKWESVKWESKWESVKCEWKCENVNMQKKNISIRTCFEYDVKYASAFISSTLNGDIADTAVIAELTTWVLSLSNNPAIYLKWRN